MFNFYFWFLWGLISKQSVTITPDFIVARSIVTLQRIFIKKAITCHAIWLASDHKHIHVSRHCSEMIKRIKCIYNIIAVFIKHAKIWQKFLRSWESPQSPNFAWCKRVHYSLKHMVPMTFTTLLASPYQRTCHPDCHYWYYYRDALTLSHVTVNYMKI